MEVILIDNYRPDRQESMLRFTQMLASTFSDSSHQVKVIFPRKVFGVFSKNTSHDLGKWLGYVDKWILFPVRLFFLYKFSSPDIRFHICDHSNSIYLNYLPRYRTTITCHDVLAIRGALGYKDAYCEASRLGRILQKWILKNLLQAPKIACVSKATLQQLVELNFGVQKPGWRVVHNSFNSGFRRQPDHYVVLKLEEAGLQSLLEKPYILHVGSNLPRKNRKMLLEMVDLLKDKWIGNICFAGHPMDESLLEFAEVAGLRSRIIEVSNPPHALLEVILNGAQAFVFPSFSEGFGWPAIEAQASGTPVISSTIEPMPEVGGDGAYYADPSKPEEYALALIRIIEKPQETKALIEKGFANIKRFDSVQMCDRYLALMQS